MRVGLVTWAELPGLSVDDLELLAPLAALGAEGVPVVWSDPSVEWGGFDALVLRSTWDYHRRYAEFLDWVGRVGRLGRLWNPPEVVRWNGHKSYLADLERQGVPILPTRFCPDLGSALGEAHRAGWTRAVLKPAVSAGGYRTLQLDLSSTSTDAPAPELLPDGEVLVQPYEPEVERSGERSLVYLGGRYSHAFLRAPRFAVDSPLREGAPVSPAPDELEVADRALRCSPRPPVYARVDLVREGLGSLRVMELELIEPFLGLRTRSGSADRFAGAIMDCISVSGEGRRERPRGGPAGRPEG